GGDRFICERVETDVEFALCIGAHESICAFLVFHTGPPASSPPGVGKMCFANHTVTNTGTVDIITSVSFGQACYMDTIANTVSLLNGLVCNLELRTFILFHLEPLIGRKFPGGD